MSDWKPGFRHQVTEATGYDQWWRLLNWRCVDCGQWFVAWPSDDEACPGPPADTDPLRQEVGR
jgi:hypothetical protein